MSDQEREELAAAFEAFMETLDNIETQMNARADQFPGIETDRQFITMKESVVQASDYAEGFADYIRVATDENWKERR